MTHAADATGEAPPRKPRRPFYGGVIDVAELRDALEIEDIDEEIAVLRVKLREHIAAHPHDLALMLKSVTLLVRATTARYRMSDRHAADLGAALERATELIGDQFIPE